MKIDNYRVALNDFIINNIELILLLIALMTIVTLIIFILINVNLHKISKKYRQLTRGNDGLNLEQIMIEQAKILHNMENQVKQIKADVNELEQDSLQMIKKVYLKRYNAFLEMGSDLSFSLVLLNGENTGFILTSIYGRDENRIFLKPIEKGKSSYKLSQEEMEVLHKAISS